jgi:pyridoxamine 5'-phosphate oxidase
MFVASFSDPFDACATVWERVRATAPEGFDPSTMTLATADGAGRPSARMVLVRGLDRDGCVFFTNYGSRKAADLAANPNAALCGFWFWLRQQLRIEGHIVRASVLESDAYFASRPRGSQLGAWASRQSSTVRSRQELEDRLHEVEARFEGRDVPRPDFWGGFRLIPERFEFWEEGEFRLHDRLAFTRVSAGWTRSWLAP